MSRKTRYAVIVLGLMAAALFAVLALRVRTANSSIALLDALRMDDTARAMRCLASGADPNVRGPWEAARATPASLHRSLLAAIMDLFRPSQPDATEPTALMIAARHGNPAAVAELVRRGADVNARMAEKRTALMWAAGYGDAAIVKTLLNAGAKAGARDSHGDTALTLAEENGETRADPDVVRLLAPSQAGAGASPAQGKPGRGHSTNATTPEKHAPVADDVD